jgi:glycosyltransferase involved in cell wall biosynthesis
MNKPKLFVWCDFLCPTGFGNVAMNLLEDMYKDYDVSILGINYDGTKRYDTSKYFVYPITRADPFGFERLPLLIKKEQPDKILLFQDIFNIAGIIQKVKELAPQAKIISYFPTDGSPFSLAWRNVLEMSDALIYYTDWAKMIVEEKVKIVNKPTYKLYHGVNPEHFYPLSRKKISELREQFKWTGKFSVININRFQPRKFITGTMLAWSMFAKGYKICKCGHHMPIDRRSCDLNMCPPDDIVASKVHNRNDIFLYLHMMPKELPMGPGPANMLQNHLVNAGFLDVDMLRIIGVNARNIYGGEVGIEEINEYYNAANYNITSTLGEGCGLSLIEAAACGTPSIAPKNSAIPEMLQHTGKMINHVGHIALSGDNGHLRPVVSPWEMTLALEEAYQEWKESGEEKHVHTECIANVDKNFRWEDKRNILRDALNV